MCIYICEWTIAILYCNNDSISILSLLRQQCTVLTYKGKVLHVTVKSHRSRVLQYRLYVSQSCSNSRVLATRLRTRGLQAFLYGVMASKVSAMLVARCPKSILTHRCTPLAQASVALKRSKCSWNTLWISACSASLGTDYRERGGAANYMSWRLGGLWERGGAASVGRVGCGKGEGLLI